MSGVKRFEELIAWQRARELTREIYRTTRQGQFVRDFGLAGQIQRATVSITSNIAEGFERNREGEFHQFLSTAKASCAEVRSQLYVAFDVGYINRQRFEQLLANAETVARILGGLRASVEKRRDLTRRSQHSAPSTQH
jgi:four helix bundle protein